MAVKAKDDMGRKKTKPDPKETMGVINIRGTNEWKQWVEELAAHKGWQVTMVIDEALRDFAAKGGFTKPRPKRF